MIHDLAESLFKNSVFAFNGIQYRISSITPLSQKDNWDPFSPIYTDPKGLLVQFEFHSSGETTEMKTRDNTTSDANWTPDPGENQSSPKNPHQERVIKEKQDLDEKAMRLSIFIGRNPEFANLKQEEQRRLTEQLKIMWQYSEILGKRIEGFGNE